MTSLRRILSVLLILGLALGTTAQAAQVGMMAGCEGCASDHETGKDMDMDMAGCHSGVCIVLPGLLPGSLGSLSVGPDSFTVVAPTVADGLSLPPDHRPPRPASLA